KRDHYWNNKRCFFMTPQVLQNDLKRHKFISENLVCLVIDEAHRAMGSHAYSEVVKEISCFNSQFRILALTATPASDPKAVQEIVNNLLISHIEIRTEESIDVKKYVNQKEKKVFVLELDPTLQSLKNGFINKIMKPYLNLLNQSNCLHDKNPETLSVWYLMERRNQCRQIRSNLGTYEVIFSCLILFARALENLMCYGLNMFYKTLTSPLEGDSDHHPSLIMNLQKNIELNNLVKYLNELRNTKRESHPKFQKLKESLNEHFSKNGRDSKVIIFANFREIVEEIFEYLKEEDQVRVATFVGQSHGKTRGLKQKEQIKVLEDFKNGMFNVIVATSIGEEGLDIGEVDLIVCFDAQASPIRMLQRFGRTGRKRSGEVILLLSAGKEQTKYKRSKDQYQSVQKAIIKDSKFQLYQNNPQMIPNPSKCKSLMQEIHLPSQKFLKTPQSKRTKTLSFPTIEISENQKKLFESKRQQFSSISSKTKFIRPLSKTSQAFHSILLKIQSFSQDNSNSQINYLSDNDEDNINVILNDLLDEEENCFEISENEIKIPKIINWKIQKLNFTDFTLPFSLFMGEINPPSSPILVKFEQLSETKHSSDTIDTSFHQFPDLEKGLETPSVLETPIAAKANKKRVIFSPETPTISSPTLQKFPINRKRKVSQFLDLEAANSEEDDDELPDGEFSAMSSFINDESQHVSMDDTSIYLRSLMTQHQESLGFKTSKNQYGNNRAYKLNLRSNELKSNESDKAVLISSSDDSSDIS
ncbi:hypothetical protein ROZALSC1DRAFT_30442, partial [Rozella allomycis CSF55]